MEEAVLTAGSLGALFFVLFCSLWMRTCTLEDQVRTLTHRADSVQSDCQHRVQMLETQADRLAGETRLLEHKLHGFEATRRTGL